MDNIKNFKDKSNKEELLNVARMHVAQSRLLEEKIRTDMEELDSLTQRAIDILDQLKEGNET